MANRITQDELKQLLHYDPATGIFTRLVSRNARYFVGEQAGSVRKSGGRRYIVIDMDCYAAHRLAFLYMTGKWPTGEVDHRNTRPDDNRWDNLRDATKFVNQQNLRRAKRGNSSGFLGVHKRSGGGYRARIYADGRLSYLGTFDTPELAHSAYVAAKRAMHPGCTL